MPNLKQYYSFIYFLSCMQVEYFSIIIFNITFLTTNHSNEYVCLKLHNMLIIQLHLHMSFQILHAMYKLPLVSAFNSLLIPYKLSEYYIVAFFCTSLSKCHWLNCLTCNTSLYIPLEVSPHHTMLLVSADMVIIRCYIDI